MRVVCGSTPVLAVAAAAPAYAASSPAQIMLKSIVTGAMDLSANTLDTTVRIGIYFPGETTVLAGKTFSYVISVANQYADPGVTAAPFGVTTLPISTIPATGSVSTSPGTPITSPYTGEEVPVTIYTYTITFTGNFTNMLGVPAFYAGGMSLQVGPGALITTADSGSDELTSEDMTVYTNPNI